MSNADLQDRVQGILIGLAAGDRNGGPIRMATLLAESLAGQRRFDGEHVFSRYLDWWQNGGFDTGPVAARVFDLAVSGVPHRDAVAQVHAAFGGRTAGCNPAHRSPPLAMAAFLPNDQLPALASQEAALTHHDPLAGDVAAATVVLCRALVKGAVGHFSPPTGHRAAGTDAVGIIGEGNRAAPQRRVCPGRAPSGIVLRVCTHGIRACP